jgi:hypothetical protein
MELTKKQLSKEEIVEKIIEISKTLPEECKPECFVLKMKCRELIAYPVVVCSKSAHNGLAMMSSPTTKLNY